jgi:hypothetical protein
MDYILGLYCTIVASIITYFIYRYIDNKKTSKLVNNKFTTQLADFRQEQFDNVYMFHDNMLK